MQTSWVVAAVTGIANIYIPCVLMMGNKLIPIKEWYEAVAMMGGIVLLIFCVIAFLISFPTAVYLTLKEWVESEVQLQLKNRK